LAKHLEGYDRMYQTGECRGYACIFDDLQIRAEKTERKDSLRSLAQWAAAKVDGGKP
jgi:hypothetical protein